MNSLTLKISDNKYHRLQAVAHSKGMTIDSLLDEVTTSLLTEFELKKEFEIRSKHGQGKAKRGLELLAKAEQANAEFEEEQLHNYPAKAK